MTLIKSDFMDSVAERSEVSPGKGRLVGLICDEYPLVAEVRDCEFLGTARSRGAFMIAAVQSLLALDERLGRRSWREALVANFNSFFFLNSREAEMNELATLVMGYEEQKVPSGDLFNSVSIPVRHPLCELGALAQLDTHHAFIRLADGSRTKEPAWLEPRFYESMVKKSKDHDESDDLRAAVRTVQVSRQGEGARRLREATLWLAGMLTSRRLWLSSPIVTAIGQTFVPERPREEILQELQAFRDFTGVDDLPSSWLAGLLAFLKKRPIMAATIKGFFVVDAMLMLDLTSGVSVSERSSFLLHKQVNLCVYPTLWRKARTAHLNALWAKRPDLRTELARLPQWTRVEPIESTEAF
jgi:hypothetical protein